MELKISDELYTKLAELAKKEFRTPELQLEYLLTCFFLNPEGFLYKEKVLYPSREKKLEFNKIPASADEINQFKLIQAQFQDKLKNLDKEIAQETLNATVDENNYKETWSSARRKYEIKEADANKKMLPTLEQIEEIKNHHIKIKGK